MAAEEEGVSGKEAFRLLRESRHLQIIALVIAFAAVGAGLIEQQLNMAAEAFKGRAATDNLTRVPGAGHALPLRDRLLHPGGPHEPDPPLPGRRLRPPGAPDEPGRDRPRHAAERRPVGAGHGADPRHVAALHPRQDDAGGPVPPPADRPQVPGEALRGRDGRPLRQGAVGAPGARPHQALGPRAQLAADQLREPGGDGPLGAHRRARAARVPGQLPAQHRAAGGGSLRDAVGPRRPGHGRGAGRGSRPPRRGAGPLRDRPARGARPPAAGDAAPPAPRVGEGAGAGPARAGRRPARAAGALGGSRRAALEGRERRGEGRRGPRARGDPGRGRRRADAALPGRPRPAGGHDGRGDPGGQRERGGRRRGRAGPRAARGRHAGDGSRGPAAGRGRARRSARRAVPIAARAPDVRPGPRGRARGGAQRRARRGRGRHPRRPARLAPPPPRPPRGGEGRARGPGRERGRGARPLPGGGERGRGGAAPDPGDPGPPPVAAVRRPPRGEPRPCGRGPP